MLSTLSPTNALFLANLNRAEQRLAAASAQVSSGKRLVQACDAPDEVAPLLQLRADHAHNTQVQANLTLAKCDAQAADDSLTGAISLLERAGSLAAQAATGTQTAATRAGLAPEIQSLLEQMVSYSQTQVQGRYIFSGDQSDTPQFQLNLGSTDLSGVDQLTTATSTRVIEDSSGGTFAESKTAADIFGPTTLQGSPPSAVPAPDNAFAALNGLRLALLANDPTGITTAIDSLKAAATRLNSAQSYYGAVQNRIQDASTLAERNKNRLETAISSKEDADIPAAAVTLMQSSTQLQAAMTMQAKLPTTTLFNFLA